MRIGRSEQEHGDEPSPRCFRLDADLPADVCLDQDDRLLGHRCDAKRALSCFSNIHRRDLGQNHVFEPSDESLCRHRAGDKTRKEAYERDDGNGQDRGGRGAELRSGQNINDVDLRARSPSPTTVITSGSSPRRGRRRPVAPRQRPHARGPRDGAWPAAPGESGVETFNCAQNGVIYQKDRGPATPLSAPR